jgi:phosphoribosylanthranilate isomerase
MPFPRIKVCGITRWSDARLSVDLGADALGFNFYKGSPRFIPPSQAARIIQRLPRRTLAVGVFVNSRPRHVLKIAKLANLQMFQLHGAESPRTVRELARHFPVLKAFCVRPRFDPASLSRYPAACAFLLDAYDPRLPGGTGKTFNWRVAKRAAKWGPIVLAGGLSPTNVADAIRFVQPFAIDVCGGVESRPGQKDPQKLADFMQAVQSARKGFA